MIYTLTLNPAVDLTVFVSSLCEGQTNRSQSESILFGGKGINVSCVLKNLGVNSKALGFIAGFTGAALEKTLSEKGIDTDFIGLKSGFTRINVKLKGETETEINGSGPKIDEASLSQLFSKLLALENGDTLILSGSAPASLSPNIYAEIMESLSFKDIRFVVDAAGELLERTLKFKPFLIKPNLAELEGLVGENLNSRDEIICAANLLIEKGAQNVLVSLEDEGAILVCQSGEVFEISGHKGSVLNSVGAGDSMLAAFLAFCDEDFEYALKYANAAGAACAFSDNLPTREQIEKIFNNK
jgi:1-phosphofructokinase